MTMPTIRVSDELVEFLSEQIRTAYPLGDIADSGHFCSIASDAIREFLETDSGNRALRGSITSVLEGGDMGECIDYDSLGMQVNTSALSDALDITEVADGINDGKLAEEMSDQNDSDIQDHTRRLDLTEPLVAKVRVQLEELEKKSADHAAEMKDRIDKFNALPWWQRIFQAI
jgi:hypothetical protein